MAAAEALLGWGWTPEGTAAWLAVAGGLFELLRRRQPKVGIRWFISHGDLGVGVYNDGGRAVDVTVELVNLHEIRQGKKRNGNERFMYTQRDQWNRVLRPGEETLIKLTSPFTANWIDNEEPGCLVAVLRYRRWWRVREERSELDWAHFFNDIIPNRTPEEETAYELKQLRDLLRKELSSSQRCWRRIERSLCQHEYDPEGRYHGKLCERCRFEKPRKPGHGDDD